MIANNLNIFLGAFCILGALTCVFAEWRRHQVLRIASKIAASSAFVTIAAVNGAFESNYGRLILIALILSWAGDIMLLSLQSSMLLGGIGAFFLAHLAFGAAFVLLPIDGLRLVIGLLFMTVVAAILLSWLWPHLESFYRFAVPAYLAAIVMMTSLAIGASSGDSTWLPAIGAKSGDSFWLPAIGAVTFAASDISVARDRFVERGIVNKAWGLPLYYAAQIMLAISVLSHG
ncbi:MAG: lysoplasmalogenase [Pyrinomonadaceae bacterium]|nr:lysoplasmalogenase [Pyrinomonadaceae bacterium]